MKLQESKGVKKRTIEEWRHTAGAVIAHTRDDVDVTQKVLAEAIGVSEDTMGAIESGRRKIDVGELIEIAKTLGVHPMKLLQRILEW